MKRTPLKRRSPLRKRRRVKSLRKRLWPTFAALIKRRDGGCLMAGQHGACGGSLQGSHVYPKGEYPLLELYPLNCKTLCWRHHWWWHHNPLEARAWFVNTFPQAWQDQLLATKDHSLYRKGWDEATIRAEWTQHGLI